MDTSADRPDLGPAMSDDEGRFLLIDVMAAAPTAMAVVGEDLVLRYVNPHLEQLFGHPASTLVGRSYDLLFPERMRPELRQGVSDFFAQEPLVAVAWRPDFPARRSDGSEFPIQYSAVPVQRPTGAYVIVTLHDVSPLRESEARTARLSRAYLTLARLNEAAVRAPDASTLYAETCRIAVEDGGFVGAWVAQTGPGGRVARVAHAGVVLQVVEIVDASVSGDSEVGQGPTSTALREQRAVFADDIGTDPGTMPWHDVAQRIGVRASASLPLLLGGRVVAVLTLYAAQPGTFDEETRGLLATVATNVSHALETLEAQERLASVAGHRRELLRRLVRAEASERDRLAADLHDDAVQALAAIDLRLGLVRRQARDAAPQLEPALDQIWGVLGQASASLRELLFTLEAPDADAGLRRSVVDAAEHVFLDSPVVIEVEGDVELPAPLVGQALMILKEALRNVVRHADARRVTIVLRDTGDGALLVVGDDGVGIGPDQGAAGPGHRGVATMRDRAELAGGWLRLERASAEGGTEVTCWLPREGREEDVPPG